jgi:hypothetical protein
MKIRIEIHTVFLAGLMMAAATLPSHGNLVPNGDVEKEDNGTLAAWMPQETIIDAVPNNVNGISNGYADIIWDTASCGDGKGSLLVKGLGIRHSNQSTLTSLISPKISLKENTAYKLAYSWKGNGLMAPQNGDYCRGNINLRFYAGNGTPGYANYFGRLVNNTSKNRDTMIEEKIMPAQEQDSDTWQKAEYEFTTPAKTTDMQIGLWVTCTKPLHPYSFWFDNISVEPVGESAPAPAAPPEWKARTLPPRTARGLETGDISFVPPVIPNGSRIQRTMKLLATSTPEHKNRVKILVYGQSIVADGRDQKMRLLIDELRTMFPNADIVSENRALGGFTSDKLKNTAETDLYPFYPDLVIMHDYSGGTTDEERRLNTETIYAGLRGRTTAEMLTLTHHLSHTGFIDDVPPYSFFKTNQKLNGNDSDLIRLLADKYGFEIADMRMNWEKFLVDTRPAAATDVNTLRLHIIDYIQDTVHHNPRGGLLMERIVREHFKYIPEQKPYWLDMVKVYTPDGKRWAQDKEEYPTGGAIIDKPLKFEFEGNRIDLLGMPLKDGKPGSAKVLIDGKAPSAFPEVYVPTRATLKPKSPWLMVTRVELGKNAVPEEWTMTYTKVAPAMSKPEVTKPDTFDFEFELKGSVTGPDGKGNNKEKFVSNSGRITLDPQWYLGPTFLQGYVPPVGFEVKWNVVAQGQDVWQQKADNDPALEDRCTLVQGISNGKHTLEIIPNGDGPLGLRAIVVYQPSKVAPVE